MRGNLIEKLKAPEDTSSWQILCKFSKLSPIRFECFNFSTAMEFDNPTDYMITFWSGTINDTRLRFDTVKAGNHSEQLYFHSAMVLDKAKTSMFCCRNGDTYQVSSFKFTKDEGTDTYNWVFERNLPRYENDDKEMLLQLKLDQNNKKLLGTTGKGFVIWKIDQNEDGETTISEAVYLPLPHGVRNITTKMMQSNSIMVSMREDYAVAGVRKNLYVWCMETFKLAKVLDAHFGRIIQLEPLTIGNWNNVITSSIDRSVKVWNINNIFEKVHVIDRHELQIDNISLSSVDLAVTVTRGCVGVWDTRSGRLLTKLADSPLGAIVTHAEISPDGKYIISSETGKFLIWNRISEQVIFRDEQPGIQQMTLLDEGTKIMTVSCPHIYNKEPAGEETNRTLTITTMRTIPDGNILYRFEFQVRVVPGLAFRQSVMSADGLHIIVCTVDKSGKDCIGVYNALNGSVVCKIPLKGCAIKVSHLTVTRNLSQK